MGCSPRPPYHSVVLEGCSADGCWEAHPVTAVCHRNILSTYEWICLTLWFQWSSGIHGEPWWGPETGSRAHARFWITSKWTLWKFERAISSGLWRILRDLKADYAPLGMAGCLWSESCLRFHICLTGLTVAMPQEQSQEWLPWSRASAMRWLKLRCGPQSQSHSCIFSHKWSTG